jgi:hypothetical protein
MYRGGGLETGNMSSYSTSRSLSYTHVCMCKVPDCQDILAGGAHPGHNVTLCSYRYVSIVITTEPYMISRVRMHKNEWMLSSVLVLCIPVMLCFR